MSKNEDRRETRYEVITRHCGGYGYWPLTMAQDDARWCRSKLDRALSILRWYAANCACACGGSEEMQAAAAKLLEEVESE